MELDFFNILSYFIVYSFLGWIMESVFRSFCEKKLINTGFLIGPFCPIYGAGSLIMVLIMGKMQGNIIGIFFVSIITLTFWEYIVGVFLEKVFKTKYWDYSDHKINFQGRICLTNSIAWGFLGVGFINYINPFVWSYLNLIPQNVFSTIIYSVTAVVIVDTIISIIKINNIKFKLEKVEELNEQIKQKLKEIKENNKIKSDEKAQNAEKIKTSLVELKSKRNRMMRKLYRYVYRLKKAFPAINTKEITQVLSKKIQINGIKKSKDKRRK